jgi:hypothetical protein
MSSRISISSRWVGVLAALACVWLAAPAAASASYGSTVLGDGPLVYYPLNETAGSTTAVDSTANHVDGAATNATFGFTPVAFTGAVSAVSFSGNGEIAASLASQAHTAELWVRPTVKNAQMSFLTHGDPSADGWTIGLGAKRKLVFMTAGRQISSRLPVGTNRWTMIDVTWTATKLSFAVNGGQTQYKTLTLPVAAPGPASDTGLQVAGGPLGGVKGAVDEVALYPTALTRAQVGSHFSATGLPVNTVAPVVSGTPRVGDTLNVTPGTWTSATNPATYQWQMCDPTSGTCNDISGATGTSLLLDNSELGQQIQVIETESNLVGSSSAISNQTAAVVDVQPAGGPVNVTLPSISGSAVQGQTLTADPGSWDPASGLTFAYQWQRCDVDGENCSPIGGATSDTYLLGVDDVGSTVDVVVTANDGTKTSDPAESDATDAVTAPSAGGGDTGGNGGSGTGTGGSGSGAAGGVLGSQVACTAHLASPPKRVSKRQRGFGKVALRFTRGSGNTALKVVLAARKHTVRSVEFRLDGKRVKRLRRSPFRAGISVSRLKPGAAQTLKVIVTPRHGSKFSLKVRLRVAACS